MKRTYISYVLVLLGGLLPSCKHDEVKPQNQELIAESIPYFASEQEFDRALVAVGNMSQAERDAYEAQRGYQSIGSISERFYQTIDFESLQSEADFHQLVADHGDYLQLVEDEDGELTLETRYYDHPVRYLINRDGLVLVGDTVVKVFEEGTFRVHRRDLQQVASLRRMEDCPMHLGRFEPKRVIAHTVSTSKSAECFGQEQEWDSKNGSNRLRARIYIYISSAEAHCEVLVRPYKRTGAWFWCKRTISASADITWGYKRNDGTMATRRKVYNESAHTSSLKSTDDWKLPSDGNKNFGFERYSVHFTSAANVPDIISSCPR